MEEPLTSPTLLGRLREGPNDGGAWERFVARYRPPTLAWCLKRGLQHADAEDVTQEILVRVSRSLRTFEYDPTRSFRGWLHTVCNRAIAEYYDALKTTSRGSGDSIILQILGTIESRKELISRLDGEFDVELLEEAMARVRLRVEAATWAAFHATAFEGASGTEVARRLGMNITTVYKARSRIQGMIRDELRRLDPDSSNEASAGGKP